MNNDLISRSELKKKIEFLLFKSGHNSGTDYHDGIIDGYDFCIDAIDNAPTVEGRMFYVQETVNTILNSCTGNTDIDKAFRNAARLVQNAIDGKSVDFEEIERSEEE